MAAVSHSGRFPAGYGGQARSTSSSNNAPSPSPPPPAAAAASAATTSTNNPAAAAMIPPPFNLRQAIQSALLSAEPLARVNMKLYYSSSSSSSSSSSGETPPPSAAIAIAIAAAARDFGGRFRQQPCAVVYPSSPDDILRVMLSIPSIQRSIATLHPSEFRLCVAARGNGHSVSGQAQAADGIVIEMQSLKEPPILSVGREGDGSLYAEVCAGRLWIEVLDAAVSQYGLAPRSWTDYLYLSVGGTLQNAGVGGQCFRHGPQISNVTRLDVITASGEVRNCSATSNPDLFYGSLGGLGQLGIITKARIVLEVAPQKVRWIRLVYTDFKVFTKDQEHLITMANNNNNKNSSSKINGVNWDSSLGFDYVEGFVVTNSNDPVNGWPTVLFSDHRDSSSSSSSSKSFNNFFNPRLIPGSSVAPVLYCLEVAKYYKSTDTLNQIDQRTADLLRPLRFVAGLRFEMDVTYREFLDRVHAGEEKLRGMGLWEGSPHPWLCLFVPAAQIHTFDSLIFKQKLRRGVGGPMLVYPMLRSKWPRCSAVIPEDEDEEVFYMVALLRFMSGGGGSSDAAMAAADENEEVVRIARAAGIKLKRYLPHFNGGGGGESAWVEHFGPARWAHFRSLKQRWDPNGILAPGQNMPFSYKS